MSNNGMTIAEFVRLLDVYGSDRTRWPVEARACAGQLVARDKAARRLLAEAEALDKTLERAPLPSLAAEAALADRIIATARRSPRMVPASNMAAAGRPGVSSNVVRLPSLAARPRWLPTGVASAAGMLAASLALGVFLGVSSLSQGVVPALEDMTGISLGVQPRTVAQVDLLDEDLL
ncbi:MAG: hypothetical protein J2P51_15565 [Hyphomicrobiaceae bacterium]|nr:hypothetical protein [Hyphomicrobiaceae bacterium]